ncbi:MAG: CDP-alcohol phosphatidyltransferase family protein, partial [Candidatus Thiodiazotropha sp.]
VLGWNGLLPWWLVGMVILRDAVIVLGAAAYRHVCHELTMEPTLISKLNTVLQILLGLLVIAEAMGSGLSPWWLSVMIGLVALSTLWSGFDYVLRWGMRARRCSKEGK